MLGSEPLCVHALPLNRFTSKSPHSCRVICGRRQTPPESASSHSVCSPLTDLWVNCASQQGGSHVGLSYGDSERAAKRLSQAEVTRLPRTVPGGERTRTPLRGPSDDGSPAWAPPEWSMEKAGKRAGGPRAAPASRTQAGSEPCPGSPGKATCIGGSRSPRGSLVESCATIFTRSLSDHKPTFRISLFGVD